MRRGSLRAGRWPSISPATMPIDSTTFLGTAARDSGGAEVALNPFGALSVDIADATGKRYNLAPEQLATITFPAPPAAEKAAPQATLKLG